ncbi:phosphoribosyltransferase family protein [Clostridium ganghwense]|uniref:Phosphoribosyltransferase family protein n=1 Tax=Clostridium ganghwense TaxID=312089 RepID=A0ABT4CPS3_9CLOT|nr:phosphoribosyltransferase family protein [Clostridium ganghwense]MCY6370081.1 phosphoribosyltransferase family protein [Clostridium ganghwense]
MKKTLKVLDKVAVDVQISENIFDFELEDLFLMAARKNPKRAFLFVSKLLGKHIPVNPKKSILTGRLIGLIIAEKTGEFIGEDYNIVAKALGNDSLINKALSYADEKLIDLKKPTLFVGFAETATALGNSVFAQFKGENIEYIHTTRDDLEQCISAFDFEEEHSHATSHFCYPMEGEFLSRFERIVLVDDEITTGKTALNLIKSIDKKYPNKEYIVASILDWRSEECIKKYKELEEKLGIKIKVVSLLDGQAICNSPSIEEMHIQYENNSNTKIKYIYEEYYENGLLVSQSEKNICEGNEADVSVKNYLFKVNNCREFTRSLTNGENKVYNYLDFSGRFGLSYKELRRTEENLFDITNTMKPFEKELLVLGTEEFMYIPMVMASMVEGAVYQSTTRSPIYVGKDEDYGIKYAAKFKNPFDKDVINYVYNIGKDMYKEVVFVTEREIDMESKKDMINLFYSVGIHKINFVYFTKN